MINYKWGGDMSKTKKILVGIFGVICMLFVGFTLTACGEGKPQNDNKVYSITYEEGDYYSFTSRTIKQTAGEIATFKLENEPFIQIDKVYANEIECVKGEDGEYTFTMPQEDVLVTVTYIDAPEILEAKYGMTWSVAPSTITKAKDGDSSFIARQSFRVDFGEQGIYHKINAEGYLSEVEIISTNESVIPLSAISGVNSTDDSVIYECYFSIDLTQVSVGETTLVVVEKEYDRIISKTVNVVPYGEATPNDLWEVSVTVDLSDIEHTEYKDKNFRIFFSDESEEYVYGSIYSATQIEDFTWADLKDGKLTFTFDYNPDHKFTVDVAYEYYVDRFKEFRYNNFTVVRGAEEDGEVIFDFNGDNVEVSFDTSNLAEEIV